MIDKKFLSISLFVLLGLGIIGGFFNSSKYVDVNNLAWRKLANEKSIANTNKDLIVPNKTPLAKKSAVMKKVAQKKVKNASIIPSERKIAFSNSYQKTQSKTLKTV